MEGILRGRFAPFADAKKTTDSKTGLPIAEIMEKCNDMVVARLRVANATLRRGILRRRFAPFADAKKKSTNGKTGLPSVALAKDGGTYTI